MTITVNITNLREGFVKDMYEGVNKIAAMKGHVPIPIPDVINIDMDEDMGLHPQLDKMIVDGVSSMLTAHIAQTNIKKIKESI